MLLDNRYTLRSFTQDPARTVRAGHDADSYTSFAVNTSTEMSGAWQSLTSRGDDIIEGL
jgi:hypothetical protein